MTDIQQLHERTAFLKSDAIWAMKANHREGFRATMITAGALVLDWQSAYDQQAEQIKVLREALEYFLPEIMHGEDVTRSLDALEMAEKALAQTEPLNVKPKHGE